MLPGFQWLIGCISAQGDPKGVFFRNTLTEYETAAQMKEETR